MTGWPGATLHGSLGATLGGAGGGSGGGRGVVLVAVAVTVVAVAVVFLSPTVVAAMRRLPNVGSVLAINVLLGWTLVGWAVAWALALRTRPAAPAATLGGPPAAGWYADPLDGCRLRYWSGWAWTDAVALRPDRGR